MVSFSRVEPQLDKFSNLHVIYQTSSRTFLYTMINPQGQVILRQTHDYTTTRPRLGFDESGKVVVVGGVRHLAENDIPPSDPLLSAGEAKPRRNPDGSGREGARAGVQAQQPLHDGGKIGRTKS